MSRRGPYVLIQPTRPGGQGCPRCGHNGHDRGCPCCREQMARPAREGKRRGRGFTKSPHRKIRRNRRRR